MSIHRDKRPVRETDPELDRLAREYVDSILQHAGKTLSPGEYEWTVEQAARPFRWLRQQYIPAKSA